MGGRWRLTSWSRGMGRSDVACTGMRHACHRIPGPTGILGKAVLVAALYGAPASSFSARSAWNRHFGHWSVTCRSLLTPASMVMLAVRRSVEPRQLPRPAPVTLDLLCLQCLGCVPGHRPGLHHHLASAGQPAVPRMLRGPALRVVGGADVGALSTGVVDRVGDNAPRGRPGASRTS